MNVEQDNEDQGSSRAPSTRTGRLVDRTQRQVEAAKQRYRGSSGEHLWNRLESMDVINQGMLFAAVLLLCFFPFLIVGSALAGRSAVTGLVRHMGLNHQAAADVSHLFASSTATSNSITGAGYVFFVLGGIAAATAIQGLYERAFDLETRGIKDTPRRLAWLGVVVGGAFLAGWAAPDLHDAGGPALVAVIGLAVFTGFWWFTMWFLLGGRVHWRYVLPAAVATGLCWLGMELVFSTTLSNMVISNSNKYGPIGVVFALMSYLIAVGVVIILGAVLGVVWRERELSLSGAFRRLWSRRSARKLGAGGQRLDRGAPSSRRSTSSARVQEQRSARTVPQGPQS